MGELTLNVENDLQLKGKALIDKVIDPEIYRFQNYFQQLSGTPLTKMEIEVLRAYLYSKIVQERGKDA